MKRLAIVLALTARSLRHRPGGWLLLAVGTALALTIPIASSGAGRTVAAQTVRRAIETLPPADRAITVTQQRPLDATSGPADDATVARELHRITSAPVRREVIYRQLTVDNTSFFLAGADALGSRVRLTSGRLPQSCTPTRCEVVAVGGDPAGLEPAAATLGVVVVGQAVRTDPTVISGPFDTGGTAVLLADGIDGVTKLSSLELFGRTYAWVAALDADRVLQSGLAGYVRLADQVAADIASRVASTSVFRPDQVLKGQDERAALSTRRFGLLGGSAAVLVLGFAVLAAVSLRRDHQVAVRVLRRRGASLAQVGTLTAAQCVAACLVGAVLGVAAGATVTALLARSAGTAVGATVAGAVGGAAVGCVLLVLAAIGLAIAALLWPAGSARSIRQALDIIAVACVGAAVLAAQRGTASSAELASGTDPLVVALPVLISVAGGLAALRLWPLLTRLAERVLPRRALAGRLGLLGALRRPLRALTTVALLAAAIAAVVFAGGYRATLLAGAADEAAFAVPLDATLTTGPDLVQPVTAVPALPSGVSAYGVTRTGGIIRYSGGDPRTVNVLGVDDQALPHLARWQRTSGGTGSAAELAAALRAPATAAAPTIPPGARTITLSGRFAVPNTTATLYLAGPAGGEAGVTLHVDGAALAGTLPDLGGPAQVVALALREDADYATHHQHAIGEGNTDQPVVAGSLSLSGASADGTALAWDWTAWTSTTATVRPAAGGLTADYQLQGAPVVLAPGALSGAPLAVAVDPDTARTATNGRLVLTLGNLNVPAQVVAVLPRMPTVSGAFVLTDRRALAALLDRDQPGTGTVTEVWLSSARTDLGSVLDRAPFDRLTVQVRSVLERRAVTDPVSSGSRTLLAVVAGLALLVSAVAVVLLVAGERRDSAGELFAWEADGVRPAVLRRTLFLRAVSVVAVAVPVGLVTGLILTRVAATLIAVSGSGAAPQPPLQASFGLGWAGLVLLVALAGAVGLAQLVAARSLRERLPGRPEVDLR